MVFPLHVGDTPVCSLDFRIEHDGLDLILTNEICLRSSFVEQISQRNPERIRNLDQRPH